MVNERLRVDAAAVLEGLQEQLHGIAELQRQRALLTATATVYEQRVQVTVNADGLLIETRFADDIGDLSYDEIATGMTEAVQAAAAEVARRSRELMEPLLERRDRLPKLSEFVEGAPDLGDLMPVAPAPPTVPPSAPEWPGNGSAGTGFGDGTAPRSLVADEDW